ncbi:MAG: hypothetical protein Q9188_006605 [Gyalolechia gomerana]
MSFPLNSMLMTTIESDRQIQQPSAASQIIPTPGDPSLTFSASQNQPNTALPVDSSAVPHLPSSHQWPNHQAPPPNPSYAPESNVFPRRRVTMEEADRQPWRYRGYPALSTWVASDDDFFMIRKFEKLGARVVLLMQNKIVQLEEAIHAEDANIYERGGDNGRFAHDPCERRVELMDELIWRLDQYQRFVLQYSQIKERPSATKRQISYLQNWLKNNNDPIHPAEVTFIEQEGDLMPVVPMIKPPLRRFIDRYNLVSRFACWRIRKSQLNKKHYNHPANYESDTTIYNDEKRIDKFVTSVTIGLGLAMLIAPLWLLQYVYAEQPDLKARLKVITGFLVGFTVFLSVVAVAKPFEVLAATAAYGAVVTVFMQLGSSGSGSSP